MFYFPPVQRESVIAVYLDVRIIIHAKDNYTTTFYCGVVLYGNSID